MRTGISLSNFGLNLRLKNDIIKRSNVFVRLNALEQLIKKPRSLDKSSLDNIIKTATEKVPLITSLVMCVAPKSSQYSSNGHIISIKLMAILVILCQSIH